jgi:hypothetical protein
MTKPLAARALALLVTAVACAACGLQPAGVDGVIAARNAALNGSPANVGAPGGSQPSSLPGVVATPPGQSVGAAQTPAPGSSGSDRPGSAAPSAGKAVDGPRYRPALQTPGLRGELVVSLVNVTGWDQMAQIVVVNTASTGDARAQAQALASYVNSHGGIAGRKLVLKVHDYNAQDASEVNDNNLCQQVTSGDKAFMVNLQGQIHYTARDCYAAKGTLAFEGATFGWSKDFFRAHSPSLWSPSYASYDESMRALVDSASRRKWFAGQEKVGVILWDDKPFHDIVDGTVVPALKAAGVKTVVKAAISNADIGAIENGIHAAAQTMVANGVTHLMFAGSAPLQPFFVQQNQQQRQFVYALTSFDIPRYMATEFRANMAGAIGVGFSPVNDVLDAQYAFPQPGLEARCAAMYKAAGVPMPGRYVVNRFDSKQAISYCETVLLLKQVADTIPHALTAEAWTAAAERLGTSFQMGQSFRTSFGPGKHSGPTAYRDITFEAGCGCMAYTSGNRILG